MCVCVLGVCVQSAEEKVPVWYIMDEFGSKVQHSDKPSCGMAPFFYAHNQLAYSLLWPLQDLQEGGTCLAATQRETTLRSSGQNCIDADTLKPSLPKSPRELWEM